MTLERDGEKTKQKHYLPMIRMKLLTVNDSLGNHLKKIKFTVNMTSHHCFSCNEDKLIFVYNAQHLWKANRRRDIKTNPTGSVK